MILKLLTIEQMWAFVYEDHFTRYDPDDPETVDPGCYKGEPNARLGTEVACNGCGQKENMAVILTLAPYRNKCFKCDAEWMDRELEGWC